MPGRDVRAARILTDFRANTTQFESGVGRASRSVRRHTGTVRSLSQQQRKVGASTLRFAGALTGIASVAYLASRAFRAIGQSVIETDTHLTRLESLVGLSRESIIEMRREVEGLAGESGLSRSALAQGLFQITSAGLRGERALAALRSTSKGAVIGLGDVLQIADGMTNALNSWGQEALSAQQAMAIMLATVRAGKIPSEQLAGVIGRVSSQTAELGIQFGEVGGILASLSRGRNINEAATQLAALANVFIKITPQAQNIFKVIGVTIEDVQRSIVNNGLQLTLQSLRQQTEAAGFQFAELTQSLQATNAALGITGRNFKASREVIRDVADTVTGELDVAYNIASNSLENRLNRSLEKSKGSLEDLAEVTLPPLLKVFDGLAFVIVKVANALSRLTLPELSIGEQIIKAERQIAESNDALRRLDAGIAEAIDDNAHRSVVARRQEIRARLIKELDVVTKRLDDLQGLLPRLPEPATYDDSLSRIQQIERLPTVAGGSGGGSAGAISEAEKLAQARSRGLAVEQQILQTLGEQERRRRLDLQTASLQGEEQIKVQLISQAENRLLDRRLSLLGNIHDVSSRLALSNLSDDRRDRLQSELSVLQAELATIQQISAEIGKIPAAAQRAAQAEIALEKLREQQDLMARSANDARYAFSNFFDDIVSGARNAEDAVRSLLSAIIASTTRQLVFDPISNSLSAGLGSFIQGLFGGVGGVSATSGQPLPSGLVDLGRAEGGPVYAGRGYLVGERGPERFVPGQNGQIIPNDQLGGGTVQQEINFNISSTDGPGVQRAIATFLPRIRADVAAIVLDALSRSGGARRKVLGR